MLAMGFVLTLQPMAGLGSLAAVILGLKALLIINRSTIKLVGVWMAWWCLVVGSLQTILLLPQMILLFPI